jgi:serine phosphatase RsbU (regulator of sigma subunit)
MYGVERLQQFISLMDGVMSSEEIIKAIMDDVTVFSGNTDQYDDMTVVVVKRL